MKRFHSVFLYVSIGIWGVLFFTLLGVLIAADVISQTEIQDKTAEFCSTFDEDPPVITLNGDETITLVLGNEYVDDGVQVVDYCSFEQGKTGEVDTNALGEYSITYTATDVAGNVSSISRKVVVRPEYRGTIYLTFDDGPGAHTARLLDILKKYNVKATFFVTGAGDDAMILREFKEGHAIGLHSWSHNYSYIYQNIDNFFADLNLVNERVKRITGEETHLMRFPGGSSNTVSALYDGGSRIMTKLASEVTKRGYTYFDWNISSGDAGGAYSAGDVYNRVVWNLFDGGNSVVLQHDIKGFSVDAVENIIKYGLDNGYAFKKLEPTSFAAHHGINN